MAISLSRRQHRPRPPAAGTEAARAPEPVPAALLTQEASRSPFGAALTATARWSLRLLVIAAALFAGLYVLGKLWVIVLPALLALLLSTVLWPLARLLRRAMPAAAAATAALLVGILAFVVLGAGVAALVAGEVDDLTDSVVSGLEDVQDWTTGPPLNLDEGQLGSLLDDAVSQLQGRAQDIAGYTLTGISTVGALSVTALLALVLCFFFLKDGPRFLPWLDRWLPARAASHAGEVSTRIWRALSGFIRAQAAVGLIDAIGIGVGLALLGVPLAVPLAVLTFVAAFVPIVGALFAGVLAVLVALATEGTTTALLVAGLVLLVQQLEGNLISPIMMSHTLALHPAMTILAVTAGSTLAGVAGAFLAVPALAVAVTLARYVKESTDVPRPTIM